MLRQRRWYAIAYEQSERLGLAIHQGSREFVQIAFGMYDLQFNWGDGGLSCTGRVVYTPSTGGEVVWTEGHPFDAVPVLRLLQQRIESFDGSSEGELRLRFSNGDRLTVARDDGPEGFTIHQVGQPLIVG